MRTTVKFQRVTSDRIAWIATVDCLSCGAPVTLRRGAVAACYRIGAEFIGIACDDCLSEASRARLVEIRNTAPPARRTSAR